jgi:hypothetical protein
MHRIIHICGYTPAIVINPRIFVTILLAKKSIVRYIGVCFAQQRARSRDTEAAMYLSGNQNTDTPIQRRRTFRGHAQASLNDGRDARARDDRDRVPGGCEQNGREAKPVA